jgi:hypothetical protein
VETATAVDLLKEFTFTFLHSIFKTAGKVKKNYKLEKVELSSLKV